MKLAVNNKHIDETYPLVARNMEIDSVFDKATCEDFYTIEIGDITDLLTLDSLCKACNPFYDSMTIKNGVITLNDNTMYKEILA